MATVPDSVHRPGRLGDPDLTFRDDPRADPRIVAALAAFGLDVHPDTPPVSPASSREELLGFIAAAEQGFQAVFAALTAGLAPVDGVVSETRTIAAPGGHEITLFVHRPAEQDGPLPGVLHCHGGGMTILRAADPTYVRVRESLAATGLVVVGVEFRNAGGALGAHPFPAGLDDCVAAARWVAANRAELGIGALVVAGESGGGNLALATTLRAKREGWLDEIAGVHAQCPYISNRWADPTPDLPSLRENDHYFVSCDLLAVLAAAYDPDGAHAADPTCWPWVASDEDLAGLPPHVISVNELDPLRDEGLGHLRRLLANGVDARGVVVAGTCHGGDLLLPGVIPEVYAATIREIKGFADTL